MTTTDYPLDGVQDLAARLRQFIPNSAEKAVLLAELGDGYAIPQVAIRDHESSPELLLEETFELADMLHDFWDKHVSSRGVPWVAMSLAIDKSGFSFKMYDIPEFGRRSQRDLRSTIQKSCFESPTADGSIHL